MEETYMLIVVLVIGIIITCIFLQTLIVCCTSGKKKSDEPPQRSFIIATSVSTVRVPRTNVTFENEADSSSIFPSALNPPPYSAVQNVAPPSYDEAIKQQSGQPDTRTRF